MRKNPILLLFFFLCVITSQGQTPKIDIRRNYISDNCIEGYLFVNDTTALCNTLELPYTGNITDISTIPAGNYEGFIRTDGSKGWRIELKDVQGRSNIQIHVGNYTSDILGCTLVGMNVQTETCTILNSADAIKKLQQYFNQYIDTNIKISFINP